jgi:hypothetical protein
MTSSKFTLLQVMQYLHMFQYHVTHIHRSRFGMYIQLLNHKFFLPLSAESRLRRPVEASNAYTLTITAFVGDTYTSDNQTADDTTWRRPLSLTKLAKSQLRQQDSATPGMRTHRLMIRPTAQHGGVSFLCQLVEIRPRRLTRAGNTPAKFGYAGDAYTLADETVDGTTWWCP